MQRLPGHHDAPGRAPAALGRRYSSWKFRDESDGFKFNAELATVCSAGVNPAIRSDRPGPGPEKRWDSLPKATRLPDPAVAESTDSDAAADHDFERAFTPRPVRVRVAAVSA